jgi:hypothetical protein
MKSKMKLDIFFDYERPVRFQIFGGDECNGTIEPVDTVST